MEMFSKTGRINIYGTRYLSRSTIPRRIAGNRDVPDITTIMIIMFMKISVTNMMIPFCLERFLITNNKIFTFWYDTILKDHFD
jgi:hypothetical protein